VLDAVNKPLLFEVKELLPSYESLASNKLPLLKVVQREVRVREEAVWGDVLDDVPCTNLRPLLDHNRLSPGCKVLTCDLNGRLREFDHHFIILIFPCVLQDANVLLGNIKQELVHRNLKPIVAEVVGESSLG
jgi:hypothetical protein